MILVEEALRPRGGPGRLLDWDDIRRRAKSRLRAEDTMPASRGATLERKYAKLAAEVQPALLETVGGLPDGVRLPPFEALDRSTWVDLNLQIMARTLDPVLSQNLVPNNRLVDAGRMGLDRYVALILAFLSHKVLGQYDPQLLGREEIEPPALYLVEPNIAAWEAEADLPGDDLRRWLILHELTHAWQFAANPWLREHLNEMLERILGTMARRDLSSVSRIFGLAVGLPEQWAVVRQMQSTMTVVEGYGNFVMNRAGRRLLPSFEQLEEAYRRRTGTRSALEVLFLKLTGLDLKMQQYSRGETFCQAVYERWGMEGLNRVWESADHMPTATELDDPDAWWRRVGARAARPA
jgi:coenzyme F420 biosynthesis associated uncharacterized protein